MIPPILKSQIYQQIKDTQAASLLPPAKHGTPSQEEMDLPLSLWQTIVLRDALRPGVSLSIVLSKCPAFDEIQKCAQPQQPKS